MGKLETKTLYSDDQGYELRIQRDSETLWLQLDAGLLKGVVNVGSFRSNYTKAAFRLFADHLFGEEPCP